MHPNGTNTLYKRVREKENEECEKVKSNSIMNALLIGMMIGIVMYSIKEK